MVQYDLNNLPQTTQILFSHRADFTARDGATDQLFSCLFMCHPTHVICWVWWFDRFRLSTSLHSIDIQWVGVHRSVWICLIFVPSWHGRVGSKVGLTMFDGLTCFLRVSGHGRAFALPHWIWSRSAAASDFQTLETHLFLASGNRPGVVLGAMWKFLGRLTATRND